METSSIISNCKEVNVFSLSAVRGLYPCNLLQPTRRPEYNVIPPTLNAATPVGAVRTVT